MDLPVEPRETQTPDLERTGEAIDSRRGRSVELTVLTVLAVLYTMYIAREFLVPIVFAVLLNFLLSPVIRYMRRYHIKPPIAALLVVVLFVGTLGSGVYALSGPAQGWLAGMPTSFARAQDKLRKIIQPMQRVSENVERAADAVGGREEESSARAPEVVVQSGPSVSRRVFGTTSRLVAGLVEVLVLLYFLLAGGDLFLQKLIKVLPHLKDKVKAVEIARATESAVSSYLTLSLLMNIGEGLVVAGVLWMIGLPNPLLWGVLVTCLEFVPYLGALVAVLVLSVAGLTTFDSVGQGLLPPIAFLVINTVQANFVAPQLLGKKLTLNPVAIFVGLAFFFYIWGVPGAFLAVPLLATFKIVCDHIASLAAIGEFLGQRDDDERRVVARV